MITSNIQSSKPSFSNRIMQWRRGKNEKEENILPFSCNICQTICEQHICKNTTKKEVFETYVVIISVTNSAKYLPNLEKILKLFHSCNIFNCTILSLVFLYYDMIDYWQLETLVVTSAIAADSKTEFGAHLFSLSSEMMIKKKNIQKIMPSSFFTRRKELSCVFAKLLPRTCLQ